MEQRIRERRVSIQIFFMIPPTAENLVKYEKLTDRDLDFFGYHVDKWVDGKGK